MYVRLDLVKTIVYYIHYTGLRVNVSNIINIYPRSFVAKYFSSIRIEEPFKSHKFCLIFYYFSLPFTIWNHEVFFRRRSEAAVTAVVHGGQLYARRCV